ncbi:hypothetical protein OHA98_33340 [Streptomyces sp. NBC_00654]|uniref:hypothetical protein n=1 Tax=Streptomyces sp. NBC_00654 TaxID=2975799 RepID=UPI002253D5A2|nr:hypothetical protein [Streptomyces sp. NBC_00654]MCX4969556.1 hypothetical protein [Streptomyces sp. NBC_00654]
MRSIPLTFCAAAAAAAIVLPASAALAVPAGNEDHGSVSVTPSTVAPGGEVQLWVDVCGKGKRAKGESDAFVSEAHFSPADGKGLFAEATIRSDAAPRSYEVRVTCKDGKGRATGTLTVMHHGRPSPVAPVRAGGGGTATLADQAAESDGPGTRHAVTGLVLAAVAAVAVAFRTVRRRRPASD